MISVTWSTAFTPRWIHLAFGYCFGTSTHQRVHSRLSRLPETTMRCQGTLELSLFGSSFCAGMAAVGGLSELETAD